MVAFYEPRKVCQCTACGPHCHRGTGCNLIMVSISASPYEPKFSEILRKDVREVSYPRFQPQPRSPKPGFRKGRA
jgi:hypothetical protein